MLLESPGPRLIPLEIPLLHPPPQSRRSSRRGPAEVDGPILVRGDAEDRSHARTDIGQDIQQHVAQRIASMVLVHLLSSEGAAAPVTGRTRSRGGSWRLGCRKAKPVSQPRLVSIFLLSCSPGVCRGRPQHTPGHHQH